jgi:hypothetical protein
MAYKAHRTRYKVVKSPYYKREYAVVRFWGKKKTGLIIGDGLTEKDANKVKRFADKHRK